jgi:hypothetical protein
MDDYWVIYLDESERGPKRGIRIWTKVNQIFCGRSLEQHRLRLNVSFNTYTYYSFNRLAPNKTLDWYHSETGKWVKTNRSKVNISTLPAPRKSTDWAVGTPIVIWVKKVWVLEAKVFQESSIFRKWTHHVDCRRGDWFMHSFSGLKSLNPWKRSKFTIYELYPSLQIH